jgi:hypothetical protein
MYVIRNAPGQFVVQIARPVTEFTLRMAASSPLVRLETCTAEALGADLYHIRAIVKNLGYLPTHLTELGRESGDIAGVEASIRLDGAELIMNDATQLLGHLDGMASRPTTWSGWSPAWGVNARRVEWLVRATSAEAEVEVSVSAQKGGVDCRRLRLGTSMQGATEMERNGMTAQ